MAAIATFTNSKFEIAQKTPLWLLILKRAELSRANFNRSKVMRI